MNALDYIGVALAIVGILCAIAWLLFVAWVHRARKPGAQGYFKAMIRRHIYKSEITILVICGCISPLIAVFANNYPAFQRVMNFLPILFLNGALLCTITLSRRLAKLVEQFSGSICPKCLYPIVGGSFSGRCPECGLVLDPAAATAAWEQWRAASFRRATV